MKLDVICTGDELITGQIVDTNSAWLSQYLFERGLQVSRRYTVADNLEELREIFDYASQRADVVIVNGGLGPTTDDLSIEAMGLALEENLVLFPQWVIQMESLYKTLGQEMPPSNIKQAMLPASARILDNPIGTACGVAVKLDNTLFYFTPGVPSEFKRMVDEQIWPDIQNNFKLKQGLTQHKLVTFGLSESGISDKLEHIILPEGATFGYRAASPITDVKLIGQSDEALTLAAKQMQQLLGDNVICSGAENLPEHIQMMMLKKNATLSLAESCTGGLIASQLVSVSGSSAYLERGYVTYTNKAKQQNLNVLEQTLEKYGAVSIETAIEMAQGARQQSATDYALSVTGIAGPTGGSEAKPVGTVAFALATPDKTYAQVLVFPNRGRQKIRDAAATLCLDMLRRYLEGKSVYGEYEFIRRVEAIEQL